VVLGHAAQDGHLFVAAAVVHARLGGRARGQRRAAGVEAAAARDQGGVGGLAGEDLVLQVVDLGHDREQGPGVGVAGGGQDGLGRSLLDDPAQVHDGQPVGDVPGQAEVVGDDQDGQAEVADQAQQQGQDLAPDRGVEARHRLVGHQHARLQGQRPGDHHPLALAARQLVRVAGGPAGGQADLLQQLPDPSRGLLVGDLVVQLDGLGDLVADPADGVEGVHGPLEHDRGLGPADGPQPARPHGEHVLALQQHAARGLGAGRQQPQHGRGHGRLAAA
jgi:hypothetical protein